MDLQTHMESLNQKFFKMEKEAKEFLSLKEVSELLGMAKSYLYRLTSQRKIPHYKPMGKTLYFSREEVVQWALSNRVATNEEIEQQAQIYCMKGGAL